MNILSCRVDERLVHGQYVREWLVYYRPAQPIIIDDELMDDEFMSMVYKALAPLWIQTHVLTQADAAAYLREQKDSGEEVMILAKTPAPFVTLCEQDIGIERVTLADKMYFSNRLKLPPKIRASLAELIRQGIDVAAQISPTDEAVAIEIKLETDKRDAT